MLISEFVKQNKVSLKSVPVGINKVDGKSPFKWLVTITYEGKSFSTEFTQGASHIVNKSTGLTPRFEYVKKEIDAYRYGETSFIRFKAAPPKIEDVIYCLKMDANSIEQNPLWEDFASDLGMNEDSRKDYKIFEGCQVIYGNLRKVFGSKFNQFLECEEG